MAADTIIIVDYSNYTYHLFNFFVCYICHISPSSCLFLIPLQVYSYNTDVDCEPFSEDGSLWAFAFFFYNRKLKRVLFLFCQSTRCADIYDLKDYSLTWIFCLNICDSFSFYYFYAFDIWFFTTLHNSVLVDPLPSPFLSTFTQSGCKC